MRLAISITLILYALAVAGQANPAADAFFPSAMGTTWVYSARVKFSRPNTDVPGTKTLRWTVTVADSVHKGDVFAVLLKGGPWDLAWYEPDVKPQEHLIVRIGDKYYLLHDDVAATLADIKAGNATDLNDRLADDIWFQTPMEVSENYCAPEAEEGAPLGCWSVEKITTAHSFKLAGLPPMPEATQYVLYFMTNPDSEMVTLVPGVGITAFQYEHHGTIAEASLKLIEYRRPGPSRPAARVARKPLASQR